MENKHAFPTSNEQYGGISQRLLIASMIVSGFITGSNFYLSKDDIELTVKQAYEIADELIRQEYENI